METRTLKLGLEVGGLAAVVGMKAGLRCLGASVPQAMGTIVPRSVGGLRARRREGPGDCSRLGYPGMAR